MSLLRAVLTLGLSAAILGLGGPAPAETAVTEQMTCPVGGERFRHETAAAFTTFGQRPDGKPYSLMTLPMALPECPKVGLVMYRIFSKEEIGRLPGLLADPAFKDLRQGQAPYYRAAWLEHALKPHSPITAWLLLNASWEADEDPARKANYQDEFIDAVAILAPEAPPMERFALQVRAANALRELGRFDQAASALKSAPREALDADPNRAAWTTFLEGLERVIARADRASEPLDLIPPPIAAAYCLGGAGVQPRVDAYCRDTKLAEVIQAVRAARGGHAAH